MLTTNQILHKGRYRIINLSSQDEIGGIYEAYDTVSNTNVVLRESIGKPGKIVTSTQMDAINSAFAGGAKVLTEINHDSLVSVRDYFSEINHQYLVLEAVTGSDLGHYTGPDSRRPQLTESLSWADQLLGALSYLHRMSPPITHGDIRPENIKLTSGGKVKLLTAMVTKDAILASGSGVADQSPGGAAFCYRPLEQLWDGLDQTSQRVILKSYDEAAEEILTRPLDARSDLYSLAASFYHIMTGTPPPDALERSIVILDGKPDPLKTLTDFDSSIPPEVSDVFVRAMSIRREDRFESAVIQLQVLRTSLVKVDERNMALAESVTASNGHKAHEADAHSEAVHISTDDLEKEIEAEQTRLAKEQEALEERRTQLDAERRRVQLEAEQARYRAEQEKARIETERLEREAEKERQETAKRLEAERVAAEAERVAAEAKRVAAEAERVAAAEAERAAAETERLAHEAEAARALEEERLQELHTEQQRVVAEKKRAAAEAKAESEREASTPAPQPASSKDRAHSTEDDERMLLEIDAHRSGEASDEPFELRHEEILADVTMAPDKQEPTAEIKSAANSGSTMFDTYDDAANDEDRPAKPVKLIAAAVGAVVMLIAGIGYWQFAPGSVPAANDKTPAGAYIGAPPTTPTDQPVTTGTQTPGLETTADPNAVGTESTPEGDKAHALKTNPALDKTKPVPAKTPPPKKKVTVDDLINDN